METVAGEGVGGGEVGGGGEGAGGERGEEEGLLDGDFLVGRGGELAGAGGGPAGGGREGRGGLALLGRRAGGFGPPAEVGVRDVKVVPVRVIALLRLLGNGRHRPLTLPVGASIVIGARVLPAALPASFRFLGGGRLVLPAGGFGALAHELADSEDVGLAALVQLVPAELGGVGGRPRIAATATHEHLAELARLLGHAGGVQLGVLGGREHFGAAVDGRERAEVVGRVDVELVLRGGTGQHGG